MVKTKDILNLYEVVPELERSLEPVQRYIRERRLPAPKLGVQWFMERQAQSSSPRPESYQEAPYTDTTRPSLFVFRTTG